MGKSKLVWTNSAEMGNSDWNSTCYILERGSSHSLETIYEMFVKFGLVDFEFISYKHNFILYNVHLYII